MNALTNFKIVCYQCKCVLTKCNRASKPKTINANTKVSICINCEKSNFEKWSNLPTDLQRLVFEFIPDELMYLKLSARLFKLSAAFKNTYTTNKFQKVTKKEIIDIFNLCFRTTYKSKIELLSTSYTQICAWKDDIFRHWHPLNDVNESMSFSHTIFSGHLSKYRDDTMDKRILFRKMNKSINSIRALFILTNSK